MDIINKIRAVYEGRPHTSELHAAFLEDARLYAIECGVPETYASNVAKYAYSTGHGYGYEEVIRCLDRIIDEIFTF